MGRYHTSCIKCSRPLSDPISVELGMGPICRIAAKCSTINRENLFSMRAIYSWGFLRPTDPKHHHSIIWIKDDCDQNEAKSVTNDMDNVLKEIADKVYDIDHSLSIMNFLVMYCDSLGVWDGITVKDFDTGRGGKSYTGYPFSLNLRTRDVAALKLWNLKSSPSDKLKSKKNVVKKILIEDSDPE